MSASELANGPNDSPAIEVDGVRIHYRFDGPADAAVLLLSNSLGADLSMWDAQTPSFARHFRVLRYDTRGHGASSVAPGPYTIDRLGRDVVGLLDRLQIPRAHVCGLSMGGMTGLWLGINTPARVQRLVLSNTAARIGTAEFWNARIDTASKGGMNAISAALLQRWFTSAFIDRAAATVARVQQSLVATPVDGYVACCAALRDADMREAVSRIRAPTLVIAGTHDAATPAADGRLLAERITGARYLELPTAHLSNIEAADRFTDAVVKFLTG